MSDDDLDVTLVIEEQPRTEIFWNVNGQIAIKQDDQFGNDDQWVCFTPGAIPVLIRCLQEKWRDYESAHPPVESIAAQRSAESPPQQHNLEGAQ